MRYVPILKGKPAEFTALQNADAAVRGGILPIVEVIPPADETDAAAMEGACRLAVTKLADGWAEPVAVDAGYLDQTLTTLGGLTAVEVLAQAARSRGLPFLPVVRLSDVPDTVAAAGRVVAADGLGAVVRVGGDDLEEDVSTLDIWLRDLCADLRLTQGDVDLIIDVGAIGQGTSVALAARVVRDLINGLANIAAWRTLTVASGAFPADLSTVATGTMGLLPRLDAQLWQDLRARPLMREPDFGDYAIQHPALPSGAGFAPAPQIRYTVDTAWRIHKGSKKDPRSNRQFFDICAALVASGEYAGAALSWGDQHIARAAASASGSEQVGPGNATTWRQVGTSHHLATVVNRLATTGAP